MGIKEISIEHVSVEIPAVSFPAALMEKCEAFQMSPHELVEAFLQDLGRNYASRPGDPDLFRVFYAFHWFDLFIDDPDCVEVVPDEWFDARDL